MTLTGGRAWIVLAALALSLCANSFFVGTIVTRQASQAESDSGSRQGQGLAAIAGFANLFQGLPQETRTYLRAAFDERSAQTTAAMRDLRRARRDVLDALPDRNFSPEALSEALDLVRTRTTAVQTELHAIFVEAVSEMPDGMREEMAEIWRTRR